jgi:hypothetical protein
MDRAQELRTLMKLGGKADSGGAVSGKDKAKMLKMMREQQKQKEAAQVKPPAAAAKPIVPQRAAPSGLPAGFFDDAPVQAAQASAPATAQPVAVSKPATASISNLPQGFFDNPVEDLNARGITLEQYSAKVEKEEQGELDAFLNEVKGTLHPHT